MRSRDRRPTVLGLCSFTHDSAAALITGGKLTGMAEEERLSGVKHTREYPAEAVQWLLAEAGLTAADVDVVAYNFAGHRYLAGISRQLPAICCRAATRSRALPRAASFAVIHHRYRQRMSALRGMFPNAPGPQRPASPGTRPVRVRRLRVRAGGRAHHRQPRRNLHHLHQPAPTRPGRAIRYRITETISDPASLGYAYGAVTAHLGWRRGDEEGTVMALAALGDPARFRALFARAIPLTPDRVRAGPGPVPAAGAAARLAACHPGLHRRHLPAPPPR